MTYEETEEDVQRRERLEQSIGQDVKTEKKHLELPRQIRIRHVIARLWLFCQTYQIAVKTETGVAQQQNVWYLNDEVGLGISRSEDPNIVMIPFIYVASTGETMTFSIFWPVKDLLEGDFATRDFVPKGIDGLQRHAYLSIYGNKKEDAFHDALVKVIVDAHFSSF